MLHFQQTVLICLQVSPNDAPAFLYWRLSLSSRFKGTNFKLHICLEGNHDFCRLGATYPIITYLFVYRFRQYKNGSVYKIHAVILNDGPLNGFISYKILIEKEAFLSHCNKFENEMVRYLFCNCTLWCEDNIEKNFPLYVHSQIFFQIWFCTFWASILCVKNKKTGRHNSKKC